MRRRLVYAFGLIVLGTLAFAPRPADAQTVAPGPYYANPSWDQTLACTTLATCPRFIVLSNMSSAAVLDRETGLVWEKSSDTTPATWADAGFNCANKNVGGRKGWRLPSFPELASLVDPANLNPALPTGHPFLNIFPGNYWSATTLADNPSFAWHVTFGSGIVFHTAKVGTLPAWCVRGGMNADQY